MPLSREELLDLRRRVLNGYELTLDEARQVFEASRQGQVAFAAADKTKVKRSGSSKTALSSDQLNAELAGLGL